MVNSEIVAEIEKCYNECLKRAKVINYDYWNANADISIHVKQKI